MPKSRRHGAGMTPQQRSKGSWRISWYESGKRRWETVRGSRKDADRVLRGRLAAADRGESLSDGVKLTVADILRRKLERDETRRLASVKSTRSRLRPLIESLGQVRAMVLKRSDVEEYAESRRHSKEPATVNRELEVLRAAYNLAIADELLHRSPKIELLREDNARTGFLDRGDYERLRDACEEPWLRLLFVMAYHTGARPGTLLATTWERVDWAAMAVNPPGWTPRNKRVGRWPIYGDLERELRAAAMEHERTWAGVPWCIHSNGKQLPGYDGYRYAWQRALRRAGLEGVLLYDMRRTAASNMLDAGIDVPTVCQIVGWKSVQTMMRYVQIPDGRLRAAGAKIEAWLAREGRSGTDQHIIQ